LKGESGGVLEGAGVVCSGLLFCSSPGELFGAEYFVFQVAIQKFKDKDI
jgi:hypothetical protein